jgi:hypothetical protein
MLKTLAEFLALVSFVVGVMAFSSAITFTF